ncbi:hypothetical protein VTN00DRAFT_6634 [Thermoascus crustaceus]|uniref:uncharacterized protein n=1 Tax=Thermoascus crustaceus TaxID=5088 RepID=UPI00374268EB
MPNKASTTVQSRSVTSADGTKVWAEAVGDARKPAVIFVHGFSGCRLVFEKQFEDPRLVERLFLIRYDLRGHGSSDQPVHAEAYTSQRIAEDFVAVCEAFGVKKAFLAGWSYGGSIAADLLAHYGPEYIPIAGDILLAGVPYLSMFGDVAHDVVMGIFPGLLSSEVEAFSKSVDDLIDSCVADGFEVSDATRWAWIGAAATQRPAVRHLLRARTQDATNFLSTSTRGKLPLLVIQGTKDKHIYHEKMEKFVRTTFGDAAEYHRLDGVGHSPFHERPETVNRLILDFIERVSG